MKKKLLSLISTIIFIIFLLCIPLKSKSTCGIDSLGQPYDLATDFLITQYADATGQHGSFYTISNNDILIIIDGGWAGNAETVRSIIAQHNNTVNAWIISHPHQDHAGALNSILQAPHGITINQIFDNNFDYKFIESVGEKYDDITVMETFYAFTNNLPYITHLKRGDNINLFGLQLTVYNSFDNDVINHIGTEQDYQNNGSLLLKITNQTDSILFCSDIKYDMESFLTNNLSNADLQSTYVQVGHHGNWSFSPDFYLRTNATTFFIDAPSAISDNPDYPAYSLKTNLLDNQKNVFDFSSAPNYVVLK